MKIEILLSPKEFLDYKEGKEFHQKTLQMAKEISLKYNVMVDVDTVVAGETWNLFRIGTK